MRVGLKLIAVSALCGFVWMGLSYAQDRADDAFVPYNFLESVPPQGEPPQEDTVPERYTRSAPQPLPEQEPGDAPFSALPMKPLETAPASEFPEIPSSPFATQDDLIHAKYQEHPEAPTAPEVIPVGDEKPFLPKMEETTFFSGSPETLESEPEPFQPESQPAPVEPLPVSPIAPVPPVTMPKFGTVAPTNGPQAAAVTLEWVKRTEINVGQECQCDLLIKNEGKVTARDVSVRVQFPASARVLPATTPTVTPNGTELSWTLGDLAAGTTKTIQLHVMPTARGEFQPTAFVHFASAAAAVFRVQEPMLEVALKGPKGVQVGDPATQIIQVSNPGTGTARNVEIKVLIPEGLEHTQGQKLAMAIGSLNPGETRMIRLAMAAVRGGKHSVKVLAEAKLTPESVPYLRKLKETEIEIISPSVQVHVAGPGLRYKNRNATYQLTVDNDGTAVSNNVRVMHKIPAGFRFVSATDGGKYDAVSKTVAWFVGRIEPGKSSQMNVTLEATQLGDFTHHVSAMTDQGIRGEDKIATKIDGIASLTLEVNDLNDPVEVGVETAYEIHVNNRGTKHANNVSVACELPEGVELVDVKAPARHNLQGRVVVFQALPTLDADKAATYRIIVRGKVDGYQRFRARLASDSIQEPLLVEELTKFYGE